MVLLIAIIWIVAEIFVAIKVADAIGVVWMLLLLVAGFPAGIWAIRSQGSGVMRRLNVAVAEQRTPTREMLDGALVLLAGSLLIIPGFISDVFGLLLMVPLARTLAGRGLLRTGRSYLLARVARFGGARQSSDVESTAHDVPPPRLSG